MASRWLLRLTTCFALLPGRTPLKITEGVQRGMNIVSSPPTAAVIREVMGIRGG